MDWSAFGSAILGGLVTLSGALALELFRARTAAVYGLAQARWEMRRDTYVAILQQLRRLKDEAQILGTEAGQRGGEVPTERWERILELFREAGPTMAVLPLWLTEGSLDSLNSALGRIQAQPSPSSDASQFWREIERLVTDASRAIGKQARTDLRLNLPDESSGLIASLGAWATRRKAAFLRDGRGPA